MTEREQLLHLLKTLPLDVVRRSLREVEELTGIPFTPGGGPGWDDCGTPEDKFGFAVTMTAKGDQGPRVMRLVRDHLNKYTEYHTLREVADLVNGASPKIPLVLECEHEREARTLMLALSEVGATIAPIYRIAPVGSP